MPGFPGGKNGGVIIICISSVNSLSNSLCI